MNIYGGVAYKLSWEPWDHDLPHGLAVRLIRDPSYINPVWDPGNPWRLLECYYGREIDSEVARKRYGIRPKSDRLPALYMEHWTRDEWSVRVDDQIPTIKWGSHEWELRGENTWGFVPIYYIPHERTVDLLGDSQIDGTTELEKDVNSKVATLSDVVHGTRPGMLWGHDMSRGLSVKTIQHEGKVIARVIDTGHTRNVQGAQAPFLGPMPTPDIPTHVASFPQDLLTFWMMVARISPSSFGLDDTSSGRITGPVAANRMWSSMAHSVTERVNYGEAKTIMDRDILRILAERSAADAFNDLDIDDPRVTKQMLRARIRQAWPPMVPMDRSTLHDEMIERLKEGGISPETYQDEMGTTDVVGEIERIIEWQTQLAEIEGLKRPPMFGGGDESGSKSEDPPLQ
jgi:hypothetical protein